MSLFPCQFCRCTFFCSSYSWEVFNFFPFDLFNDSGNFWRKIPWFFFQNATQSRFIKASPRYTSNTCFNWALRKMFVEWHKLCRKVFSFLEFPAGSLGKQLEANQLAMDNIRQKYLLAPCIICMEAIKSCCVFSSMQKICTHSQCKARQHTHTQTWSKHIVIIKSVLITQLEPRRRIINY